MDYAKRCIVSMLSEETMDNLIKNKQDNLKVCGTELDDWFYGDARGKVEVYRDLKARAIVDLEVGISLGWVGGRVVEKQLEGAVFDLGRKHEVVKREPKVGAGELVARGVWTKIPENYPVNIDLNVQGNRIA